MNLKVITRFSLMAVFILASPFVFAKQDKTGHVNNLTTKPLSFKPQKNVFSTLTDEQRSKIKDIANQMRVKMLKTAAELRQGQAMMKTLVMADKFDEGKAKTLADSQGKLYANMVFLRLQTRHQIYQVMTPEQRKQLEEQMKAMVQPMMGKKAMPAPSMDNKK